MILAKLRCMWRDRRIAWCRKLGKFCDAPREYETCLGYEATKRLHETTPFEKVRHNIELLRDQIVPVDRTYRFVIRTLWGDDSYIVVARDTTEASVKLAKKLQMTEAELASVLKEVYELKDRRWIKIWEEKAFHQAEIPTEVKESIKRFWQSFLRTRGLLVPPYTDVPRAKAELQKALSEIEYQKQYMNPQDYEKIKAHLQWAIDFLEKGLVAKAVSELEGLFLFLTGRMLQEPQLSSPISPEALRLKPLFDMQDTLIEHKFPTEKSAIIDWIISCPGDIYRIMTHPYPDFAYVMEKWERLSSYATRPPLSKLQANDWEEIKEQINEPTYKERRDQYLANLVRLREETVKMPMDPKRQAVMIESLDMIKALIQWFESQDPHAPPRQQLHRLTDAVASYFPRKFFERPRIQTPATESLVVYRGLSDKHHERVMTEGFYPSPHEDRVYTAVKFGEAVRFAYSHVREEGGNPIVYELEVPLSRFQSQVFYYIPTIGWKATGFLTSGRLEPQLVRNFFRIPPGIHEPGKLIIEKEREEEKRELETKTALAKISEEYVKEAPPILGFVVQNPSPTRSPSIQSRTQELKERFGPELRNMIAEAEGQNREVGVMLCRTATGQPHLSRACYGRRETVTVTDCHDGLSPLGSFHVHLGGTDVFSVPDLELAIKKEQVSCLGYTRHAHPYLKCINPKLYQQLPYQTQIQIKQSLDHARQDIERAVQLYKSSPTNPEAQVLSQRAQATLKNVESQLEVYEVPL